MRRRSTLSQRPASAATGRRSSRRWPNRPALAAPGENQRESSAFLSHSQWTRLSATLSASRKTPGNRDRAGATRRAVEGVLWVLRSGAPWSALPERYPSAVTCRRRWRGWMRDGRWLDFWRGYVATLEPRGWMEWTRALARSGSLLPSIAGQEDAARQAWWLVSARVLYCESRFSSVAPLRPGRSRRATRVTMAFPSID
jgi:transposase